MTTHAHHALQADRQYLTPRSKLATAVAMALTYLASATPLSAQTASDGAAKATGGNAIEELVVTAQRREERIVDVPYNITAVTGSALAASGATGVGDLTKVVAGLGYNADGPVDRIGENTFALRGLRTDPVGQTLSPRLTVSSVATYYGDTPVFFPVLMKDLARVEVLRGPQGTLYGSGAQGGAIRFIPNRPSFDGLDGELNASIGAMENAGDLNANTDGVINLPLADNLALRVAGAYVDQAGFVDQVNLFVLDANGVPVPSVPGDLTSGPVIAPVEKDTNSWEQWMIRPVLRYQPTDWLDLELAYLHQRTESDDVQAANPEYAGGTRDLSSGFWPNAPYETRPGAQDEHTVSILQPSEAELDLVSGTVAADLGFAELTSVSSYYENQIKADADGGQAYVNPDYNFVAGYSHYPRFTCHCMFDIEETGFTQEIRLVSQIESPFSFVIGAYYQDYEKDAFFPFIVPGINAFGESVGQPSANPQFGDTVFLADQTFETTELAGFGELTYHITDAWQVTGGIRAFKTESDASTFSRYPFYGINMGGEPVSFDGKVTDHVYKFNTSYDISPDTMVYFTYAEGFRRGGVNPLATTGPTASSPDIASFEPDFAYNYEIGVKGLALDQRLMYSVAVFRIDLEDFQFNGLTPNYYSAAFNGGEARSEGVELEGTFRVTPNLTLSASYAYTDAETTSATVIYDYRARTLVDDDPAIIIEPNANAMVADGAKMPGVSEHSAVAAIDYEFPLAGGAGLILHANANYRSEQNNLITATTAFSDELPDAFFADARITYDSGDSWSASLFATNLTDETSYSGVMGVQTQNVSEPQALIYSGRNVPQPRTYGLSLRYGF